MKNQEYNLAGKTLVVDSIKQLKGSAKTEYIRQVAKTAQADVKAGSEYYIQPSETMIQRDDTSRESQSITLAAVIRQYQNPNPKFEINGLPRMCAYKTGDTKADLIEDLEDLIENETPFTPSYSGTNNWSRGGSLFEVGDTVSVVYFCSDNTYVTAIMGVTAVGSSTVTGVVTSYKECAQGFDDRDTSNVILYIPRRNAVPLDIVLYDGTDVKDTLRLEVQNVTRHRRTFGVSASQKGTTYVEEDGTEKNFIEGDSYVEVSVSGDTKTAVVKFRYQDDWREIETFRNYVRYDEILTDSLPDVFSIYQGENRVQASGYDWFKQVIAEHISAVYYFVGGAIYGYGQNGQVDMTQPVGERASGDAFIIDKNGIMEISSGYARDLNVRGVLRLWKGNNMEEVGADIEHPALTTVSETIEADPTGKTVANNPQAWSSDSFLSQVGSLAKNNIATANGSFKNKSLKRYVYADNLAYVLRNAETIRAYLDHNSSDHPPTPYFPNPYSFTIPDYVKIPIQVTISGKCSVGKNSNGTIRSLGTVSISINNVQKYSRTATSTSDNTYSYTATLYGGDVVSISATYGEGLFHAYGGNYADVSCTIPDIYLSNYVSSTGFWLEYSDGSMEKIASGLFYTSRMQMSSPVSFDSNSYLLLNDCSQYLNYRTFVDSHGVSHTLADGITYEIESNNLYALVGNAYQPVNAKYLTRNATSVVVIYEYNGTRYSVNIESGGYYGLYGTIKIAETSTKGVKMMGNYPKRDADDQQGGFDCGNSSYRWDNGYFKTLHYSNLSQGSTREIKDNIKPYDLSAIDVLKDVEVIRFNYKADKDKRPKVGILADTAPEDVSGEKHNLFIADHAVAILIKAVQELSAEIEQLKAERQNN